MGVFTLFLHFSIFYLPLMPRITLIANKNWEVEPIINALLNAQIRDTSITHPDILHYPWTFKQGETKPRVKWNDLMGATVELWCIQDIMAPGANPSSSQAKHEALPKILEHSTRAPDLVVALGTASSGTTENINGCVVLGTNVFIHNYHPHGSNPVSVWDDPIHFEKLLTSSIPPVFFDAFLVSNFQNAHKSLLRPFLNSSEKIQTVINHNFVALGSVNVTNYAEYNLCDPATMVAYVNAGNSLPVGSVETTHGVIRLMCEAPFFFMSGIVDRFTHFNVDVNGVDFQGNVKTTAQDFTGAFNIGVVLGNLLPAMIKSVV
jgi:hypothetical protein